MRKQLVNQVRPVHRQPRQHILEVGIRIMSVEFGRLDQAHGRSRTLTCSQRARKQPIRAPKRNRPDLVLDPVVVLSLIHI